nr:gelsolin isoform X1 [Ciona intestinalis]|eukprot:XP_009857886.1 gelsolin isoform X1 [Ciona intestinalis]
MAPKNLKIWRIEDFEMVEQPKSSYGYFFTGDSYLVMNEYKDSDGNTAYDLHMWIGSKSSQDEYGSCAFHAVKLDDEYGGVPVQHRETEGYESSLFMGYFKPAIKYQEGGVASGFNHVEINDYSSVKRLLWVRGRRHVRANVVPLAWSSLNKSDCFVLDMGNTIYTWNGPKCNRFEALQATVVANDVRSNERAGKAKVKKLNTTKQLEEFLGPMVGSIAEGEPEPSRGSHNAKSISSCKLFKVSDDSGTMVTTLVSDKTPFKQSMLDGGNVYIISNKDAAQIFVWKGKSASKEERQEAMKNASEFIKQEGLPSHANITVMSQFSETPLFKMMFDDWQAINAQKGLGEIWSMNKIAKVAKVDFDASTLHIRPDLAAKHQLPDNGSGEVKIWRVEGSDKALVPKSTHGQFYGGDCYIVLYSYQPRGRQEYIIYYWIGSKATADEVTALPILTIKTDEEECAGAATQVRVMQNKEPPHMMMLFGGKPMIIYEGGTSRSGGQTEAASTRLFHVRSGFTERCRAIEVEAKCSSLNSNDSFLLITPTGSYAWAGLGASDAEKRECRELARSLGAATPKDVDEGSEPDEFFDILGGKMDYPNQPRTENDLVPPRLFEGSDASGNFVVEEVVGEWSQDDLNTDNVMMLDAWSGVYLWMGQDSSANEQEKSQQAAEDYLNSDPSSRDSSTPVYKIQQGNEPMSFKGFFQGWDHQLWAN